MVILSTWRSYCGIAWRHGAGSPARNAHEHRDIPFSLGGARPPRLGAMFQHLYCSSGECLAGESAEAAHVSDSYHLGGQAVGGKGWLSYNSYFQQQMAGGWKG